MPIKAHQIPLNHYKSGQRKDQAAPGTGGSYVCKAGLGDVMLGAAATVAEYNGVAKASHIKDVAKVSPSEIGGDHHFLPYILYI